MVAGIATISVWNHQQQITLTQVNDISTHVQVSSLDYIQGV